MTATSSQIDFPVVSTEQFGRTMYVGAVSANALARMYDTGTAVVDIWDPVNRSNGYQRGLSPTRARKFGRFLAEKKLAPTSILLFLRRPNVGVKVGGGRMVIPIVDNPSKDPEKAVVSIVDGQHRIYGISEAFRENWLSQNDEVAIPVSVVFADEGNAADPLLEEAQQFLTLNNEQKRVRTDLAHQLILRREGAVHGSVQDDTKIPTGLTGKELLPYVTAVVNRLSEQSASPWYDRIVRPNSLRNTTGWPSQGQFEDSLLDNYLGLGSAASWAAGASLTTGELVRVISNYWSAIFELCPEPLTTPEEYVLTKTAGIHALNGLLPALFTKRRNLPMVPTTKAFKDVLATMDGVFTEEYWSSAKGEAASYGTSKKSFKELCRAISETITSTA